MSLKKLFLINMIVNLMIPPYFEIKVATKFLSITSPRKSLHLT